MYLVLKGLRGEHDHLGGAGEGDDGRGEEQSNDHLQRQDSYYFFNILCENFLSLEPRVKSEAETKKAKMPALFYFLLFYANILRLQEEKI